MRGKSVFLGVLIAAAIFTLTVLGAASVRADGTVSTTVIDAGTFITVKGGARGEVLSLYRIKADRIILVDTVINTSDRSSNESSFQKRYLIHLDLENR